jgi:hypothetical protein
VIPRSSRAETRNPLLRVPEVIAFVEALRPCNRKRFHRMLLAISAVCRVHEVRAWDTAKPGMVLYWGWAKVNTKHLAAALSLVIRRKSAAPTTPEQVAEVAR